MRVRNTKIQVVMKWSLEAQSNSNSGMWAYIIIEYTSVLVCSCVSTLKVRPTVKEMIGTKTEFNERNKQTKQKSLKRNYAVWNQSRGEMGWGVGWGGTRQITQNHMQACKSSLLWKLPKPKAQNTPWRLKSAWLSQRTWPNVAQRFTTYFPSTSFTLRHVFCNRLNNSFRAFIHKFTHIFHSR